VGEQSWKAVLPGAAVAVVGWLVASAGFAIYAAHFGSYNKSWGTLSAVVITLVWLWLTSAALLFGAEVNAEVRRLRDEQR
jgi:membrane protein